jgi:antitoxin ParD1/3/4
MPSSYTIGRHFEAFVQKQLASGRYSSASEVLRDALRLMEEREGQRETLERLQLAWAEGIESGDAGPLDFDELKRNARARLAARAT